MVDIYRTDLLALALHPDKNRAPRSEDAFKGVFELWFPVTREGAHMLHLSQLEGGLDEVRYSPYVAILILLHL